jgi:hypothetical protein
MALPTPESLIGMKSIDAKALVEAEGGIYKIYRRYQNPNDLEPEESLWEYEVVPNRYNVALDRGNVVVDCAVR